MLMFLDADNGNFSDLPFASNIITELHSSDDCVSEDCFWYELYYNGILLEFKANCANANHCTYPEFIQMIESKGFVSTEDDYETQCATAWSPPAESGAVAFTTVVAVMVSLLALVF